MARGLIEALTAAGCQVTLASELRTHDAKGAKAAQASVLARARAETRRLTNDPKLRSAQVWITYHNYYKAPDLLGPALSQILKIPYVIVEASRARKRLTGRWSEFAARAEAACDAARAILYLTQQDAEALHAYAPAGQLLRHLRPFLTLDALPAAPARVHGPMLSVGMMRPGDKARSYALIAQTLALLKGDWRLRIVGAGPERDRILADFAGFGHRVETAGVADPAAMHSHYRDASLFFWPGVNEAYGMVYLEAQAYGLPVVAQDRPGVRDVAAGPLCNVAGGPDAMAARIASLLSNIDMRRSEAAAARARIGERHLLPAAARTLHDVLADVL